MQVKELPQNQPAPPVPGWFVRRLRERFGVNRFRQPNICIEWGMTPNIFVDNIPRIKAEYLHLRYKIFHGFKDREFGELALTPIYRWYEIGTPCFYACDWWAPELLGESTWDAEMFGPFPELGQHRSFLKLVTNDNETVLPSQAMFEMIEEVFTTRDRMRQLHDISEADSEFQEKCELQRKLNKYNANWDAFWKKHEDALYQDIRPHMHRLLTNTPNRGRIRR